MRSRGDNSFPTEFAGQTDVQRPHSVQASRSSRSFHVNPASVLTPIGSPVSASLSKSSRLSAAPHRLEPRGVNVERPRQRVNHLRVRRPRDEAEDQNRMRPPRDQMGSLHRFDAHQRLRSPRDQMAERRPRAPRIVRRRDPPSFDQKTGQRDQKYRGQYQHRFVGVDQFRGPYGQPARGGDSYADQDQRAENIYYERLEVEIERAAHDRKTEIVIEHDDRRRRGQNNESCVNERVKEARVFIADRAPLT